MRATCAAHLCWIAVASLVLVGCGGGKPPATKKPVEVAEPAEPEVAGPAKPAEPAEPAEPADPDPEYMHGNLVWFELTTKSPAQAASFYKSLFGWQATEGEVGGEKLTVLRNGSRDIASIRAGKSASWIGFISVADVGEAILNVSSNDGTVVVPATDLAEVGRFAIAKDPDGATFALLTAAKGDPFATPGVGDWYWVELWSRDPSNAVDFYEAVADYTNQEVTFGKEVSYRLVANKAPRAGISKSGSGKSPQWVPYILVDDVGETSTQATKLKAKVKIKPFIIFGVGRATVLSDPGGAIFGLIDLTEKD